MTRSVFRWTELQRFLLEKLQTPGAHMFRYEVCGRWRRYVVWDDAGVRMTRKVRQESTWDALMNSGLMETFPIEHKRASMGWRLRPRALAHIPGV